MDDEKRSTVYGQRSAIVWEGEEEITKIGGIILPLFSGYGAGAIVSRLVDADAKALFTADGAFRRGKAVEMKSVADEAAVQTPTLKHMIVLRRTGQEIKMKEERDHWWHDLIAPQPDTVATEITFAEDPLMIIYTSGTTGKPKGALHTHCGFPVKAAQDMAFGTDVHGAVAGVRESSVGSDHVPL